MIQPATGVRRWSGTCAERRGAGGSGSGRGRICAQGSVAGRGVGHRLDGRGEPADVGGPAAVVEGDRVEPGERADALRQVGGPRHLSALDQHRNDPGVRGGQGALDLHPDEVVIDIDPAARLIGCLVQPVVADHHQDQIADLDLGADVVLEVGARRDRVDVHEDAGRRQPVRQAVVEPVGLWLAVGPAVGDEDPRRSGASAAGPGGRRRWQKPARVDRRPRTASRPAPDPSRVGLPVGRWRPSRRGLRPVGRRVEAQSHRSSARREIPEDQQPRRREDR